MSIGIDEIFSTYWKLANTPCLPTRGYTGQVKICKRLCDYFACAGHPIYATKLTLEMVTERLRQIAGVDIALTGGHSRGQKEAAALLKRWTSSPLVKAGKSQIIQ